VYHSTQFFYWLRWESRELFVWAGLEPPNLHFLSC
jgi:hypothetical protein